MRYRLAYAMLFLLLLTACGGEAGFTPKPRAFPKVVYPEKAYQQFDKDYCAFTFEYPVYAEIQRDTSFFDELPPHPCWFDVYIPNFDSRLHCSYVPINEKKDFEQLKADAFEMTDWHNKRANYIDEVLIQKPNGVGGMAFIVEGDVASPFQFFLTDSTEHFMRGSLYFNTEARSDSLGPVYEFIEEDLQHLIETFEWTE
jgi:gliding motility-associated lipoprotein GldD